MCAYGVFACCTALCNLLSFGVSDPWTRDYGFFFFFLFHTTEIPASPPFVIRNWLIHLTLLAHTLTFRHDFELGFTPFWTFLRLYGWVVSACAHRNGLLIFFWFQIILLLQPHCVCERGVRLKMLNFFSSIFLFHFFLKIIFEKKILIFDLFSYLSAHTVYCSRRSLG